MLCVTLSLDCSAKDIHPPLPPPISETDVLIYVSPDNLVTLIYCNVITIMLWQCNIKQLHYSNIIILWYHNVI